MFSPATQSWFDATFSAPTAVQRRGWDAISRGAHSLLLAPTGSGKTLAAFLWSIDRCMRRDRPAPRDAGARVVYVSPLKALAYDIERNLRRPIAGIRASAEALGEDVAVPAVFVRTGDTPQRDRRAFTRTPAEIVVTTPESLYLLLTSGARELLRTVETVIVDEVHALAPTKRGVHLALSLERLAALCPRDPQRIGLSATARPVDTVAAFLGGDRAVEIIDTSEPPDLDLRVIVPVPDMTRPPVPEPPPAPDPGDAPDATSFDAPAPAPPPNPSIWPSVYDSLVELIAANRTTLIFVNSRGLCERLAQRLNDAFAVAEGHTEGDHAGRWVRAHHGSIAHDRRKQTEKLLEEGRIRAIVATSSLELGIDMAAVDHVALVESPASVSSGLQRVGRAGHAVGETSRGTLFPKHRGDLLEAAVVARRMREGAVEGLSLPSNALDVLAQHVVAAVALDPWDVAELGRVVRRAASYAGLSDELLHAVLDMLAGRYPSNEMADLRPRLVWERDEGRLRPRRGARQLAVLSGGTIPDRGLYSVHRGAKGPRVGELDEEMVHETRVGDVIALGASSWRVLEITRDRVVVDPAPGEPARLPFWHGDGPGRPLELGRALGAFTRTIGALEPQPALAELESGYGLNPNAAQNLVRYLADQREATGTLPSDERITVESFRDELGDLRVCLLTPFGSRIHAPWALAIQALIGRETGVDVQTIFTDDGVATQLVASDRPPPLALLVPDPDEVEALLVEQLEASARFAGLFRENAARALLLPRWRPGSRQPLWAQRLKAQNLLAVARRFPDFPIVLETYRQCLNDVFDMPGLLEVLRGIRSRRIAVDQVETPSASPFARGLVLSYVASYMYEYDAPVAERRAQALTLDRKMLAELLGTEELRELLDPDVIAAVEAELQRLDPAWQARDADELHDVLRWLGDLGADELAARCVASDDGARDAAAADPAAAWLSELREAKRVATWTRADGAARVVPADDLEAFEELTRCGHAADADTAQPPPLPAAVSALLRRWARTHTPFVTSRCAAHFGLPATLVEAALDAEVRAGRVVRGAFLPGGSELEWCHSEVLRKLRQRSLAVLRNEVAAVPAEVYARFLPDWQGVGGSESGAEAVAQALEHLEGLSISYRTLEEDVLPARVQGFHPRMLDELGASGRIVWVGDGALGARDGRLGVYRRDRVELLREPPDEPAAFASDVHQTLYRFLERRGACFLPELVAAVAGSGHGEDDVRAALVDLAWAGLVSNDTFEALRRGQGSARGSSRSRRPPRPVLSSSALLQGGRWSLVRNLWFRERAPTERALARASALLERYGVVGPPMASVESLPGGFAAIYPVLRAMEERGQVRRGYFVEGLGGAQFALPGVVDRLRAQRRAEPEPRCHVLAATDPANPWGALLPWPDNDDAANPRRAAGATVVLVDGWPVLYLSKGGKNVQVLDPEPGRIDAAARGLRAEAARIGGRSLRIESIDGEPTRRSPHFGRFREAGFGADHKALTA